METDQDVMDEIGEMVEAARGKAKPGRAKPKGKAGRKIIRAVTVTTPQDTFLKTCDIPGREEMVEALFSGGVGSGKSVALTLMLMKYIEQPNTPVVLAHLHLSVLKKTTLPLLIKGTVSARGELIPPLLPPELIAGFNKSEGVINLHNGSSIILIGIKDGEKIRSINASAAFVDELTLVDRQSYFSILQRCRVYCKLPNAVYSATNPDDQAHWVYRYFVNDTVPGYRFMITVDSRSNRANLPASYIKSLERLPDEERERMLAGMWCNPGSRVIYAWESAMSKDLSAWRPDDYEEYLLANDLGGGSKWSGTLLLGRAGPCFYVLEELSTLKSTHKEILDWLDKYRSLTQLCAYDPANAVFRTDLENSAWIPLKPDKNIEMGISKLNSLLKEGRLVVSTKCQKTISQIQGAYRNPETHKWEKDRQEIDLLDALRYGVIVFDDNAEIEKHRPKPEKRYFAFHL